MATQKGMSGVDVRACVTELNACLPLWIGKIYQYDNTSFGFRLNGEDKLRLPFYCVCGIRAHTVAELPPAPKNPSGFSMYLRKYIEGGKILAIEQNGIERVIIFTVGKGPQEYRLIIELFAEGNIILADSSFVILNALFLRRFRDRDIVAGAVYAAGAVSPEQLTYEAFKELIAPEENDIVRALATRLLLGGKVSEEICQLADVSKSMPVKYAEDAQLRPVYDAVKRWFARLDTPQPFLDANGVYPVPPN